MLSETEKDRLIAQMQSELGVAPWVVLKCGVCLVLMVGLAVIGATATSDHEDGMVVSTSSAGYEALDESRRVYEERREQFEQGRRGYGAVPGIMVEASVNKPGD